MQSIYNVYGRVLIQWSGITGCDRLLDFFHRMKHCSRSTNISLTLSLNGPPRTPVLDLTTHSRCASVVIALFWPHTYLRMTAGGSQYAPAQQRSEKKPDTREAREIRVQNASRNADSRRADGRMERL